MKYVSRSTWREVGLIEPSSYLHKKQSLSTVRLGSIFKTLYLLTSLCSWERPDASNNCVARSILWNGQNSWHYSCGNHAIDLRLYSSRVPQSVICSLDMTVRMKPFTSLLRRTPIWASSPESVLSVYLNTTQAGLLPDTQDTKMVNLGPSEVTTLSCAQFLPSGST